VKHVTIIATHRQWLYTEVFILQQRRKEVPYCTVWHSSFPELNVNDESVW